MFKSFNKFYYICEWRSSFHLIRSFSFSYSLTFLFSKYFFGKFVWCIKKLNSRYWGIDIACLDLVLGLFITCRINYSIRHRLYTICLRFHERIWPLCQFADGCFRVKLLVLSHSSFVPYENQHSFIFVFPPDLLDFFYPISRELPVPCQEIRDSRSACIKDIL